MRFRYYIASFFIMGLLLAVISVPVFADSLDVNREIARRFTERGAALKIFLDNVEVDPSIALPIYKADLRGELKAKPMVFANPTVAKIPAVVAEESVANCGDNIATHSLKVQKETKNFSSWTNTYPLYIYGKEVKFKAKTPFGAAGANIAEELSATSSEAKSVEEAISWEGQVEVSVSPSQLTEMQFVVSKEKVENLPYWVDFVAEGKVNLGFGIDWMEQPFTVNIEDYLSEKDRTFRMYGVYNGVTTSMGSFRAGIYDIKSYYTTIGQKGKVNINKISEDEVKYSKPLPESNIIKTIEPKK